MRTLVKKILRLLAKLTLARYKPRVVAITGSVGKTSTKEAVAVVLGSTFFVRESLGNYNNELGVPLTIIGEESGGKNPYAWVWIFIKALVKLIAADYPKILVLEMGADRPGDIGYLVEIIGRIEVAVITDIGISHLEFFGAETDIVKEKLSLIKKLSADCKAVLNFDNPKVFEGQNQTKAEVLGFGFNEHAQVMISDFQIIQVDGSWGVNFKIHHQGTVVPFFLPNALGKPAVYAATAAAAVGLRFGINLVDASQALKHYVPPAGRLRLFAGINQTQIIDDTYNAAPDSMFAAIDMLGQFAKGRKMAVLGGMAELGNKTESGHRAVAVKLAENKIDIVILVGTNSKIFEDELAKLKFSGQVQWFDSSDRARIPVRDSLREGDTVLIKGSQATRMEKIVKEIMLEPEKASRLLVRQNDNWLAKP